MKKLHSQKDFMDVSIKVYMIYYILCIDSEAFKTCKNAVKLFNPCDLRCQWVIKGMSPS